MSALRPTRRHWLALALVFALGAGFRLAVVSAYHSTSPDGNQYFRLSQELARDHRYAFASPPAPPTYARMPGYPLFLAYVARTHAPEAAHVVTATRANVVLDLLTALILLALLLDVGLGWGAALTAAALALTAPPLFLFSCYSLSESLSVFLATAALWTAWRARRGLAWAAGAGLLAGAAVLTRADALTLLPALGVALALGHATRRRAGAALALASVAALVVLAPWCVRNLRVFGAAHLTGAEWPAQSGTPLPLGAVEWMRTWAGGAPGDGDLCGHMVFGLPIDARSLRPKMYDSEAERLRLVALVEAYNAQRLSPEVDRGFRELADERRARRPWRSWVALPLERLVHLYDAPAHGDYPLRIGFLGLPRTRPAFAWWNCVVYALGALGAWLAWRRGGAARQALVVFALAIGARTLLHLWAVPMYVNQRYLVEVMPLWIALAALPPVALAAVMMRHARRDR